MIGNVLRTIATDIALPIAAYFILVAVGIPPVWALASSAGVSVITLAGRWLRTREVSTLGFLVLIQFALGVVGVIMSETALSFLGLGVKLPDVSLGTLLAAGANATQAAPWQFYFPAGILTLLTVSMAFIADGLRDALDPNSRSGGQA